MAVNESRYCKEEEEEEVLHHGARVDADRKAPEPAHECNRPPGIAIPKVSMNMDGLTTS
jgi:hypothetical protein